MGLTSPALVALLAVLAGGLLAATLVFWRVLARPAILAVIGRIAAVVVLDLVVLGLILVIANRAGGYYASWSELFGTQHIAGHVVALHRNPGTGGPPVRAGDLTVRSRSAVAVAGHPRTRGGQLLAVTMTGQVSGIAAAGYLYVPEIALRPAGRTLTLPVIVAISDRLASKAAPFSAQQIAATAALEIAAGRLRPALIVMLPPAIAAGAGRSCLDVPGGPQAATFFTQDLPQLIQSGFRASTSPAHWALAADDSGAYCALQLTLTNSAVYPIAAAPPGHYLPPGPRRVAPSLPFRQQANLLYLLMHQPMQPVSVLLTGPAAAGQPFLALARQPMRTASESPPAGPWPLAPALDWIGRSMGTAP